MSLKFAQMETRLVSASASVDDHLLAYTVVLQNPTATVRLVIAQTLENRYSTKLFQNTFEIFSKFFFWNTAFFPHSIDEVDLSLKLQQLTVKTGCFFAPTWHNDFKEWLIKWLYHGSVYRSITSSL